MLCIVLLYVIFDILELVVHQLYNTWALALSFR
jgi:hypothetical protein